LRISSCMGYRTWRFGVLYFRLGTACPIVAVLT
jgi:hypothetical protein